MDVKISTHPMIWKLLFAFAGSVVAILIPLLDYYWHDKRTRKFKSRRDAKEGGDRIIVASRS